jgi:AcrR family transcriptional regulator
MTGGINTEKRNIAVKEKFIHTSIKLFEKKGFSETSVQDIVEALHVTKGTFYYYFGSKEQLLMAIQLVYINELLQFQEKILDDPEKSFKTKLFENVQLLIKQIKTKGHNARVFFREIMNLNEENVNIIKKKREEFRFNLQDILELGIEKGEFRADLKADMVTFAVLGMCNWSYHWFDPDGTVTDEELVEIYLDTLLNGISQN